MEYVYFNDSNLRLLHSAAFYMHYLLSQGGLIKYAYTKQSIRKHINELVTNHTMLE